MSPTLETVVKLLALTVAALSLLVSAYASFHNARSSRKNRHIRVAMQLTKDFYQDTQFTIDRLEMWERLKDVSKEQHDYSLVIGWSKDDRCTMLKRPQVVALSRTAAFYKSIRALIDSGEADKVLLRRLFGYNYTRFWAPERTKFFENSSEIDRDFFKAIPELLIDLNHHDQPSVEKA